MRRLAWAVLIGLLGAAVARAEGAADEIIGLWLTGEERSTVEIYKEGDTLCGKIVALKEPLDESGKPKVDRHNPDPALRSRPLLGLQLIWGFRHKKDSWTGGRIYDPDSGKTYYCKIHVQGDRLTARGSLDPWGMAGRTVVWVRKSAESGATSRPADAQTP